MCFFLKKILLLLFFSLPLFCVQIPFKEPSSFVDFERDINIRENKVAIVSGAGPAGLLAAWVLVQSGHFNHVILLEKRDEFTRFNTVSIRPEVFSWLKKNDLAQTILPNSIYSQDFNFTITPLEGEQIFITEKSSPKLSEVDFEKPVAEIFAGDGWPHYAIELHKFQKIMADKLSCEENFYLLNGELQLFFNDNEAAVQIRGKNYSLSISKPAVVVVAEGTRSSSREQAGIEFNDVMEKPDEFWASGVISLAGIIDDHCWQKFNGEIYLFSNQKKDLGGFGIFRPSSKDFFVNAYINPEKKDSINPKTCLKQTAYEIFMDRQKDIPMNLPVGAESLVILETWDSMLHLKFKKANNAYRGNVILLGDAYRSGSPIGGLGFSLVASVENCGFKQLMEKFFTNDKESALKKFHELMEEITHFWHFSAKL